MIIAGHTGCHRFSHEGFDKIWDNLEFDAMGTLRVGYDRWAFTTDVIYMGLLGFIRRFPLTTL